MIKNYNNALFLLYFHLLIPWKGDRAVEGTGLENRQAKASWVRIPPLPPARIRRGTQEAEGVGLLNR